MKTTHLLGYDGRSGEVEAGRSAFKARVDYIECWFQPLSEKEVYLAQLVLESGKFKNMDGLLEYLSSWGVSAGKTDQSPQLISLFIIKSLYNHKCQFRGAMT